MMREDTKFVAQAPGRVVAMTEHKGRIFVATERQVFELIDGVFHPLVFAVPEAPAGYEDHHYRKARE